MPLAIDAESADALQAASHGFLSYEGITAASAFDVSAFCSPSVPLATWSSVLLPAGRAGAAQGLALCNGALALPTALRGAFGANLSSAAAAALSDVARLPLSMSLLAAFCYFAPRQLRTEGGEALLPQTVTVLRLAVERLAQQRMGGEAALAVGAAAEAAISRATSRRQLQKGDVQAILAFLLRSGRRAPLLRLISHSPLVHEAAAGAACDAIGAAGEARSDALSLLCECVCQLPHAPLGCVGFLHEVARRRPALVAAGFESGVVHEAVHTALQNTPGRQKVAVQKATLSLLTHVLEALPRTSLHPRSLQQMVELLWGRASDEQAEAASRAHALSELSELIEGFQVYPPSASAAYVRRFSSVLQLLHADGTSSKLIQSRATALLVTLFAHAPWRRQEDTEERVAEGEGEAVPLDLEGSGEAHGAEYAAWVRCVRRHFPLLLRLAVVEPAVLQLLLHARLSAEEVRAVADAAARADGEAEAAAMRSLLRAHVIAGGWAAAAARLVRLGAAYTPTQCRVLLDAARLSEAEVAGLAAALFGEARGGGATGCELLACCAMLWAGAVVRLVPLGWVEERIDQIVLPGPIPRGAETTGFASCHEAHECVRPLLHLLNALLRAGASSHTTLQWLDERAATFLERGFVRPTIDSLFAFAPSTSRQLTCRALAKLRAAATDSPPCARLLMRALGHAAYRAAELVACGVRAALDEQAETERSSRAAGEDEYDYMLRESERDERKQLCSERTLEALRSDPIFHQLGFVRSAALDGSAAAEYRAAADAWFVLPHAVSALCRFGMAHSRVAEELVPTAVALVEEEQPLEVRCQAILLFGMCVPSAPAAAEAHIAKVLHAPLEEALRSVPSPPLEREEDEEADEAGDDGERGDGSRNGSGDEREDDEAGDGDEDDGDGAVDEIDDAERGSCRPRAELKLPRCAHTVLADLCATRKLHPARELPKLLPFVADEDLGSATSACLRRVMSQEGPIRWPRLLYLSALQLCPHLPTAELRATLGALLPEFLSSARQQELAQVGDALASQLGEAAAVALSASSGGLLLHNLAALLAAWPPTDRGLLALLRALGGGGGRGGAEGSDAPPPPLLAIARADRSLHSTLASHVQKACARPQLRGSVVDEIAQLLGAKPRSAATTDTTARDSRADDRSQLESSARSTLDALRAAKALYVTVKLPELHAAARRAKDDKVKEHLPKKRRRFASRSMEADEEDEE